MARGQNNGSRSAWDYFMGCGRGDRQLRDVCRIELTLCAVGGYGLVCTLCSLFFACPKVVFMFSRRLRLPPVSEPLAVP